VITSSDSRKDDLFTATLTVALSRAVLDDAATPPPPLLRTLDAIHPHGGTAC
jgi:hypothetical protein